VADRVAALTAGQTLVGVDEDTALVRRDGIWRVEGRQRVWVLGPDGRRTPYGAGAAVPLPGS
jgi:cyanophycinase-like exopeptidase